MTTHTWMSGSNRLHEPAIRRRRYASRAQYEGGSLAGKDSSEASSTIDDCFIGLDGTRSAEVDVPGRSAAPAWSRTPSLDNRFALRRDMSL